ncbi:MAG: secretion system protein E, partial [Betaproteobacteria bacterium HGW-Betaproteobacteria-21]
MSIAALLPPAIREVRDRRPIGQTLLDAGLISQDQLRIALLEQSRSAGQLGRVLVQLGFITETTLRDALSARLGQQCIDLTTAAVDPAALALVPECLARTHQLLPLHHDSARGTLTIACTDAHDIVALDALRSHCGHTLDIVIRVAADSQVRHAIDQHYGHQLSIDGILHEIESGVSEHKPSASGQPHRSQPVVRLIDALLVDAVKQGASDIHFEPEAGFLRIRYRVDGLLRQIRVLHHSYWPAMVVRIKVMAGLNIAETRSPQDGRISLTISGRPVDFRVSAQPTLHGENLVLRILDR